MEVFESLIAKYEYFEAFDPKLGYFHSFASVHHLVGTLRVNAFYNFGKLHEIFFLLFQHDIIQVTLDLVACQFFESLISIQRLLILVGYQNAFL